MATCSSRGYTKLNRRDRIFVSWPVTGVSDTDSADISLEDGPWWPMAIGTGEVIAHLAGPDFPSPSPAHAVPVTSHAEIRISNADITETFDGGFIQLVP